VNLGDGRCTLHLIAVLGSTNRLPVDIRVDELGTRMKEAKLIETDNLHGTHSDVKSDAVHRQNITVQEL